MLAEGLTKAVAAYEFASGGQIRTTFNPGTEEGAAAYFEGMGAVVIRKAGDAGESPLPGH